MTDEDEDAVDARSQDSGVRDREQWSGVDQHDLVHQAQPGDQLDHPSGTEQLAGVRRQWAAGQHVQRGRETFQRPLLDPRTIRPAADSVVSTHGPTGTSPPHDFPSP